jgi:simple sugar transport system permease protein
MDLVMLSLLLGSVLRLSTPLVLAAMGELVSEKAGVLNLCLEGMMLAGAFFSAWATYATGNVAIGLLAGMAAGLGIGVIQAGMTIWLRADQVVVGLGLNLFVLGLTTLLSRSVFGARTQTTIPGLEPLAIPFLSDIPVIGPALFNQNLLVYLAIAAVPLTWFVLSRTGFGLALAAAGEDPVAADRSGIAVQRTRFAAVLYTGLLCGVGGTFYSLGDIKTFVEGMTNGAGFIALVAVIFGNWKVFPVFAACLFFGATVSLRFLLPAMQIEVPLALLGALPYVAALLAVMGLVGKQRPPSALSIPFLLKR